MAADLEVETLNHLGLIAGSISPFSVEKQVLYNRGSRLTYGVYGHDPSRKNTAR
jgi:hypothetical protein